MKKIASFSLQVFGLCVGMILIAGFALPTSRITTSGAPGTGPAPVNQSGSPAGIETGQQILTPAEIAKHNTQSDCWLIINGKVYDVTTYLRQHPGGVAEITQTCGADGTHLFETKDGRGNNHSAYAYQLLSQYYVGDLGSSANPPAGGTHPSPSIAPRRGDDDDEFD
jgi:hypothetical protein